MGEREIKREGDRETDRKRERDRQTEGGERDRQRERIAGILMELGSSVTDCSVRDDLQMMSARTCA